MDKLEVELAQVTAERDLALEQKTGAQFALGVAQEHLREAHLRLEELFDLQVQAVKALYAVMDLQVFMEKARRAKKAGKQVNVKALARKRQQAVALVRRVTNDWNDWLADQ